jgi:hypothetical protein
MRPFRVLASCVVLFGSFAIVACSGGDPGGSGGGGGEEGGGGGGGGGGGADAGNLSAGEPAELAGITDAHNRVRAEVGVPPLKWNADLAALASKFIADCQFAHSTSAERTNQAGFKYVGENLYMSSSAPTGQKITDAWASEKAFYDYATNSCSKVCGHYTQIVWRSTTELGCAVKKCSNGYIVACEYGPGGNIGGQKPY